MPTDVIMSPSTGLALQLSPPETSGGGRFAFLKRAAHGSGSWLVGKSTQSPTVSPEDLGFDGSRYPDIVRSNLTERFSHLPGRACQRLRKVTEPFGVRTKEEEYWW